MSCLQLIPKPFLLPTHRKLKTPPFRSNSVKIRLGLGLKPRSRCFCSTVFCSLNSLLGDSDAKTAASPDSSQTQSQNEFLNFEMRSSSVPINIIPAPKLSLSDKAFFLLAFIACTNLVWMM